MFLSIGMLKLNYFLADIFILSAEKQPIKLSWRKIECLLIFLEGAQFTACPFYLCFYKIAFQNDKKQHIELYLI